LDWVLRASYLGWLRESHPEDLYQEAAGFLVEQEREFAVDKDATDEERHAAILGTHQKRNDFARAAQKHFYEFARALGYRRPRSSKYIRRDTAALDERDANTTSERDAQFHQDYAAVLEALKVPEDRQLWQLWFGGATLFELAHFLGCNTEESWLRCQELVEKVRRASGVELSVPMPESPIRGKRLRGVYTPAAANELTPRVVVGSPAQLKKMPLAAIMALYGVNKSAAFRIRRRGWYCPGYHNSTAAKEGHAIHKSEPPIPAEVAALAADPKPGRDGRVHVPESVRTLRRSQVVSLFGVSWATAEKIQRALCYSPGHQLGKKYRESAPEVPPEVAELARTRATDEQGKLHLPESAKNLRPSQVARLFGITRDAAKHGLKRGYLLFPSADPAGPCDD
jgi:hypothetical protein